MRILFVVGSLRIGGMERQVSALARGLVRRGHRCTVLCLTERGALADPLAADGVDVAVVSARELGSRLRPAPDVVYALGLVAYVLALPAALLVWPRALRVSGRRSQAANDRYPRLPRLSVLARRLTNRITHVAIANDPTVAASHVAEDPSLAARMVVIRNGVEIRDRRPTAGLRIVCVANFRPPKAHAVLVAAVALLPLDLPWTLHLVGDGPLRATIEAMVAELPEPGRVVLHGSLDDPRAIVEEAAVAVLTSTTEGLPNVVLEALAAGVPVVATAVGAIPELLAAGGGTAVPVNDVPAIAHAVERYLRDPALRGATGDAGRAAVRSYGIDVAVDRHLVVFEAPR